jgi:hypothetical protein
MVEEVKDIQYIELFDEKSKQLNSPAYLWTKGSKTIEPGEKTEIQLGTSANDLFVISRQQKQKTDKQKDSKYEYEALDNEKKSFEFAAYRSRSWWLWREFLFCKE